MNGTNCRSRIAFQVMLATVMALVVGAGSVIDRSLQTAGFSGTTIDGTKRVVQEPSPASPTARSEQGGGTKKKNSRDRREKTLRERHWESQTEWRNS
jgi:hypothetical protein